MASVLEANDLVKDFGDFRAVDGLSFEIGRGEIVGLLGANGAGKTTAMNMLLGLTTPTAGTIRAFGMDFASHRIEILRRANFTSAYTALPANLTVRDNLRVFAHIYGVRDVGERIREALEIFSAEHLIDRRSGHLSAGESTRVSLAKAFLNHPELLLLDEPTASLDPDMADQVRKILRRLQRERGASMLYTSHNMRDIEEVCDRVLIIHRGRTLTEGTPSEILEHFREASLENVFIRVARSGDVVAAGPGGASASS